MVLVHLGPDLLDGAVELVDDSSIKDTQSLLIDGSWGVVLTKDAFDITAGVPDLVEVVLSGTDFLVDVTHIHAWGAVVGDEVSKSIDAILLNDIDWVDAIS